MIDKINTKINRSKVNYALSLARSISKKDPASIDKIWALCGFKSKKEFDRSFIEIHGKSFLEYIETL
jgi:transcriptional regulator GlxA family with amidase domain|tara:strand:- start:1202 stop:1402 length:201 start_codon:yes stop_codon:yes gene_type:complete